MWVFHIRKFEILIPKNLNSNVYLISTFLKTIVGIIKLQVLFKWKSIAFVLSLLMIWLLFENQVSNCFITLFDLACTAPIFLSIMSILISSAKRTNFASWIFKHKSFIYNENKGAPKLIPEGLCVLFPYMKTYISFGFFSCLSVLNISINCEWNWHVNCQHTLQKHNTYKQPK